MKIYIGREGGGSPRKISTVRSPSASASLLSSSASDSVLSSDGPGSCLSSEWPASVLPESWDGPASVLDLEDRRERIRARKRAAQSNASICVSNRECHPPYVDTFPHVVLRLSLS